MTHGPATNIPAVLEQTKMTNKLNRLFALPVVLALGAIIGALPATADTLTLTGVSGNHYGNIEAAPYYISVDGGPALLMMCDDDQTDITGGESWTAESYALTAANLVDLKFATEGTAATMLNDYEEAAWIESGVVKGSINPGDGNAAVWSLFDSGFNTSIDHSNVETILANAQNAVNSGKLNFSGITIYTPNPLNSSQEFIYGTVCYNTPQAPEPATCALIGGGLVLLAVLGRRRRSRAQ